MTIRGVFLVCALVGASVVAAVRPLRAADIVMIGNDAFGTSSFNTGTQWNDGQAPAAGNNYSTAGFLLRTPTGSANYTFAGDLLVVTGDGLATGPNNQALLWKGSGTTSVLTVNDLLIDGGQLRHAQGDSDQFNIAGNIRVGSLGANFTTQGPMYVASAISGTETLRIVDNGSGGATRTIYLTSGANTFTGNIEMTAPTAARARMTLAENANLNFVIGASGTNNAVVGTGIVGYDGIFNFDLSGAGTGFRDSWAVAAATTQSFGATFTVAGFDDLGDGRWRTTAGAATYEFSESTGRLTVVPVSQGSVTWTGLSGTAWNLAGNWNPARAVGAGVNDLVFAGTAASLVSDNDNAAGTAGVASLTFAPDAASYSLTGNQFVLLGTVANQSSNRQTISAPIELLESRRFTSAAGGGDLTVSGEISGLGGLVADGSGSVRLAGSTSYTGSTAVEAGARLELAGSHTGGGPLLVGSVADSRATAVISGAVTASSLNGVGGGGSGAGAIYQTGGSLDLTQAIGDTNFSLGGVGNNVSAGYGFYGVSSGTLTANRLSIGARADGAVGVLEINGGTVTANDGVNIARAGTVIDGSASGLLNVLGGSLSFGAVTPAGRIQAGFASGTGVINVGGGQAAAAVTGGADAGGGVELANQAAAEATTVLNLRSNGVLTTPRIYASQAAPTALVNFDGGTLQATSVNAGGGFMASGNIDAVTVYAGGGTIDNAGTDITIANPLLAPAGAGVGSISLSDGGAGYIAPPLVEFSGGDGVGATGYAVLENGRVSSVVVTSPGTGYTTAPTVALVGGGSLTAATVGTASLNGGNVGGGMTFQGFGTTTLTGASTYTGPTALSAGTLVLGGAGALTGTSGITVSGFGTTLRLASTEPSPVPLTLTQGILEGSGTLGAVSVGNDGTATITTGTAAGDRLTFGSLGFGGAATTNLTVTAGAPIVVTGALSTTPASGLVTINAASDRWTNGPNPLIGYGTFAGSAGDFTLGSITGLTGRQSVAGLTLASQSVALQISGDNPVWTGANGGIWTTGTFGVVGPTPNWALAIAHTPTDFWPDDIVEFNDTVNVNGTVAPPTTTAVSIQGGSVSPRLTVFNNETLSYTLSSPDASGIATGSLVKNGAGTLSVATPNTSAAGTVLNGGRLNVNDSLALGFGSLEINGGTLGNTSGGPLFNANVGMTQAWNGDFSFSGTVDGLQDLSLGSGAVALGGAGEARTVTVTAGTLTVGPISGPAGGPGLTKAGPGTLSLDAVAASTIAGTLTVTAGTLNIGQNDMITGGLAGTGTIANGSSTTRWLLVGNATDQTFGGSLQDGSGGGLLGMLKRGAGTLQLTGTSGMSDRLTVEAGTLEISGGGAVTNASGYFITNTGVLRLDGPGRIGTNPINIGSSGAAVSTWDNRLELAGGLSLENPITFAQRNNETDGVVNVSGDNTLTGPVTIVTGGTSVRFRSDAGRLSLAGPISTTATSARTLWLRGAGGGELSGVVADNPSNVNGRVNLVKDGAGTWLITSANTTTGTTAVNGGTLLVNGSIGSSSGVTVSAGGTLAGSGTVAATTIGTSATLSPGDGVGTLSTTGAVTWASGGNLNWQLTDSSGTAGTGWDLLAVTGGLSITATSADPFKLNLWTVSGTSPVVDGPAANFDAQVAATWTLATTTAGITGFAADAFQVVTGPSNGTGGFANAFGSGSFSVAQAGSDLQLVYTPGGAPTDIVIDIPSGSQTQSQAGYPTIAAATSVRKVGAGTVVFDASNTYTGPTTIAAGTLEVATPGALAATVVTVDSGARLAVASGTTMRAPAVIVDGGTLSAGALAINASSGITSLAINAGTLTGSPVVTISAGGQMALVQDARVSVAIAGLSVDQAPAGGRLDMGAGAVSIAAGGISAADLRADLIAGRNGGAWNGSAGIMSSAAAAAGGTRAVGYVVSGNGSAQVSFAAPGDVDLSGTVNVFDLVAINSSGTYGTGATSVWNKGDFNYDGVTNVFDLVSVNTAGAYGQGNYFPASPSTTGAVSAVPEPAGWLLLSVGGMIGGLMRRSRRQPHA